MPSGKSPTPDPIPVALLGFSAFERRALESYLRVAGYLGARYTQVLDIAEARYVIADADQAGAIELLHELDRSADAVYIGAHSPPAAAAWMMRPIDPAHVLRELDALHVRRDRPGSTAAPARPAAAAPARPTQAEINAAAVVPARRVDDAPSTAPATGRLPAQTLAAKRAAAEARRQAREAALRPAPLRRALLVDSSEADLRLLDRQLQHYDLATDRAGHAGQAIALLSSQAFGFVFLDTDLGGPAGLDGLALCRQIAHHELAVRGPMPALVLVSAHHSPTDQVRAALAGADALLGKPLDLTALDRLLQRHGLRRAADDAVPAAPAEPAPPAPPPTQ